MKTKQEWEQRYEKEELPWDSGRPASCLTELIASWPKFDGKVLEIGCGTGTNSVWLAGQRLRVTGMDIAAEAVRLARRRAAEKGVECRFVEADFFVGPAEEGEFAFLFDRGCFHGMDEERRVLFARRAAACLERGGLWFSMIGNSDQPAPDDGPPRLSAGQICAAVEPFFEILRLESFLLDSKRPEPPRFWQCLMRVRK